MLSIGWLWFEIDRLAKILNFAFIVIPANAGIQYFNMFWMPPDLVRGRLIKSGMTLLRLVTGSPKWDGGGVS